MMALTKPRARFIQPMLLLKTDSLPDGDRWVHELKVDGYRAVAYKAAGRLHLRSRNDKDFSARYPGVVKGLARLPDNTVVDGEVDAFRMLAPPPRLLGRGLDAVDGVHGRYIVPR